MLMWPQLLQGTDCWGWQGVSRERSGVRPLGEGGEET